MTIRQRIQATQFKYELKHYVSHLVHSSIFARTEYKDGSLTIYLIEPELDLILIQTYSLDQTKLARKSKNYRIEILKSLRREICLGYPEIKLFDYTNI